MKAVHKTSKKTYAVKIFILRLNLNSEDSIKNEIYYHEILSKKPYILNFFPKYYGYVKEKALLGQITYHLVFEYFPYNLRDLITEGTLCQDFSLIKSFFTQMVNAFCFLQSCHIAHRDIKPENILIDETNKNNNYYRFWYRNEI